MELNRAPREPPRLLCLLGTNKALVTTTRGDGLHGHYCNP
jgi:hypothetical protein